MYICLYKNKTMKIKLIDEAPIEAYDIEMYKLKISKLKGVMFTANDIDMNKRIISLRIIGDDDLILINPKINKVSDDMVIYYEKDTYKPTKVRKTVRYTSLIIDTDNLGQVEFKPTNEKRKWENASHFMEDAGLLECVMLQRAIDAINGIDITHISRAYTETKIADVKPKRNERVMIQSPTGESLFVKYKKAGEYLSKGYSIL